MARGWESKDIESQIEEANERKKRAEGVKLTAEKTQWMRELEDLQLSRTRVLADLELTEKRHYRELLERSLAFLDEKIRELRNRSGQSADI